MKKLKRIPKFKSEKRNGNFGGKIIPRILLIGKKREEIRNFPT